MKQYKYYKNILFKLSTDVAIKNAGLFAYSFTEKVKRLINTVNGAFLLSVTKHDVYFLYRISLQKRISFCRFVIFTQAVIFIILYPKIYKYDSSHVTEFQ